VARSDRSNIRVNCPQCMATLDVDSSQSGQRVQCPKCSFSLQVPSAGVAGANLFEDLFDEPGRLAPPKSAPLPTVAPRSPSPSPKKPSPTKPESNPLENSFEFDPESPQPPGTPAPVSNPTPATPAPKPRPVSTQQPVRQPAAPPAKKPPEIQTPKPASAPIKPKPPQVPRANPLGNDDDIFGLPSSAGAPGDEFDLALKPVDEKSLPRPGEHDPLAADPNAPIIIEGIESDRDGVVGTIKVKCKVCDSLLRAPEKMLDKEVVCPDCGSKVLVIMPPKPKGELPVWARTNDDWREVVRKDDEKRFPLGVKMDPAEVGDEVPPEWGLPEVSDDLMRQLPTLEPERNEFGEKVLGGANPNRIVDKSAVRNAPFLGGVLAAQEQTRKRAMKNEPQGGKKDGPRNQPDTGDYRLADDNEPADEAHKGGRNRLFADRDRGAAKPDTADEEIETASPTGENRTTGGRYIFKLENLGVFDGSQRRWLKELVRDRELWIRSAAAVGMLGLAYWMMNIISDAMVSEEMSAGDRVMRVAFPGFFGGLCLIGGWLVALMTGGLVFQQSGDRRPRFEEWPGFGMGEWGEAFLFFCVSLWLGSLPGLLMGLPLMFSNLPGLAMVVAALSAALFSPPLLLAAWYNGSAFQVYSKDVFRQFRGKNTHWLRYLPGCMAAWILFGIGYGVLWIPLPFTSFLGAALHVAATILFATITGLYCGLMARQIEKGL